MKTFGGFFELELCNRKEYHTDGIRLNTGRNALEYILKTHKYSKIFIPYYTCDVILEPITRNGTPYEFYYIDHYLEPKFTFENLQPTEAFLYTNYFGLKDTFVKSLASLCKNLIVDNAQSFYSLPISNIPTFYSARKFFGVSDGAYLYTNIYLLDEIKRDVSINRFEHLIKRVDTSPELAYEAFLSNEVKLRDQPILQMSKLSMKILSSINYKDVAKKRTNNYNGLHEILKEFNQMDLGSLDDQIPMVYPFLIENPSLRNYLIKHRIFIPQYWPNVLKWVHKNSVEYNFAKNMAFLPIDQRYNLNDMATIGRKILNYIKKI